ncbi:MAG TPA: hypothetical protein VH475_26420 [Tepidisphaeraceae bacterium]|jgi:hypothetical protein
MTWWQWWTQSDAGLATRIAAGVAVFVLLAVWDYRRNRQRATRWREYLVLLVCTLAAILYGVINDQITSSISWEYFYYGKDLDKVLGPQTPPDLVQLHLQAALVGVKATWSAGLILGVVLLVANNPTKRLPRLPESSLLRLLPLIFLITAGTAAIGAWLGYAGCLTRMSEDFPEMLRTNLWRPRRFMAVYGIHLGGYAGSLIAMIVAVVAIMRRRRRVAI